MLSHIGLIELFCSPYITARPVHVFLFSSFVVYQGHTNKQLPSLADSCIVLWLKLYCEHLQHFAKKTSSSYFISVPKP